MTTITRNCPICGNEVGSLDTKCPFCDSPLSFEPPQVSRKRTNTVSVVVLKEGNPTVREALNRLDGAIVRAKRQGKELLKVIHGYGSSGEGGAIKRALAAHLTKLEEDGAIRRFVTGEGHGFHARSRNYLLKKYPDLQDTWHQDRNNPGITFVEL